MGTEFDDLEVRLHVRHVGFGDAFLLELPDGRCGVIDWGTTDPRHHHYLQEVVGDRELAFVAATHGHEDHTAGLPWLFRNYVDPVRGVSRIRWYITPLAEELHHGPLRAVGEWATSFHRQHPHVGRERDLREVEPSVVQKNEPPVLIETESYRLLALHPPGHVRTREEMMAFYSARRPGNRPSLVLLLQLAGGRASVLFPGDAEEPAWRFVRETVDAFPDAEPIGSVSVVAHHGAAPPRGMPAWAIQRWATGLSILSTPSADEHHPAMATLEEVCRSSERVCCTSYAAVCAQLHGRSTSLPGGHVVQEEPCYGDFVVTLRGDGSYEVDRLHADLIPAARARPACFQNGTVVIAR